MNVANAAPVIPNLGMKIIFVITDININNEWKRNTIIGRSITRMV